MFTCSTCQTALFDICRSQLYILNGRMLIISCVSGVGLCVGLWGVGLDFQTVSNCGFMGNISKYWGSEFKTTPRSVCYNVYMNSPVRIIPQHIEISSSVIVLIAHSLCFKIIEWIIKKETKEWIQCQHQTMLKIMIAIPDLFLWYILKRVLIVST